MRRFKELLPESQGQNLVLTVVYVPYSLDSSRTYFAKRPSEGFPAQISDMSSVSTLEFQDYGSGSEFRDHGFGTRVSGLGLRV